MGGDQRDGEQSVIEEEHSESRGDRLQLWTVCGEGPRWCQALGGKTNHEKVLAGSVSEEQLEDIWILLPPLNSGFLCLLNPQTSSLKLERASCGMEGMGSPVKMLCWVPLQLCWCQPGGSSTPELQTVKPAEAWPPLPQDCKLDPAFTPLCE